MLNFFVNFVKWLVILILMFEICLDLFVIVVLFLKELKYFVYCKNIFIKCLLNLLYVIFVIVKFL